MGGPAHDFGIELRRLRLKAGLSLGKLAKQTHYSKGHLSKIENGRKTPTRDVARAVDTALAADGALVALLPTPRSIGGRSRVGPAFGEGIWVLGTTMDDSAPLHPVRRGATLPADTARLFAVPTPVRPAGNGGDASLLELFATWLTQLRAVGQRLGPGTVLPIAIANLNALTAVAHACDGADQAELLVLASRYAEYAGWMAQEAGNDQAALRLTRQAVALAERGGDRTMAAYALVRQALVTLYDGDHRQTIELAQRAGQDRHASARVRGLAAQREAQGYALAVDRDGFLRAMDRAERLLDADAAGRPKLDTSVSGRAVLGTSTITRPTAVATGWSLFHLGRPDECAAVLETEIARIPTNACRSYARYAIRCALAHATARELDRACELTRALLSDIHRLDSATIRSDLQKLARRLGQWPDHPPVRALMPNLGAVLN